MKDSTRGKGKPPDPDEGRDPQPKPGEPFNPHWKICGFYPPEIVGRNTELKLTDGQKRLYEWLVCRAGQNAEEWYPFKKIAEALGKCVRQVKHDAAVLEEKGLIAHVFHHRHPNRYCFLWHPIFKVQPTALKEDAPRVQDSTPRVQGSTKKRPFSVQPAAPQLLQEENYIRRITSTHAPPSAKQQKLPGFCASSDAPVSESALAKIARPGDDRESWFDAWWPNYWRKVAKQDAQKAFKKHVRTEELFQQVMAATRTQTPMMMAREPDKRPHGATWINGARWNDEPSQPARVGPQKASAAERLKARWAEKIAKGERPI